MFIIRLATVVVAVTFETGRSGYEDTFGDKHDVANDTEVSDTCCRASNARWSCSTREWRASYLTLRSARAPLASKSSSYGLFSPFCLPTGDPAREGACPDAYTHASSLPPVVHLLQGRFLSHFSFFCRHCKHETTGRGRLVADEGVSIVSITHRYDSQCDIVTKGQIVEFMPCCLERPRLYTLLSPYKTSISSSLSGLRIKTSDSMATLRNGALGACMSLVSPKFRISGCAGESRRHREMGQQEKEKLWPVLICA